MVGGEDVGMMVLIVAEMGKVWLRAFVGCGETGFFGVFGL
jgi:hypothetical protein